MDDAHYADPLFSLSRAYKWDADIMQCRDCKRHQQVTWRNHRFQHRADCSNGDAEPKPWLLFCLTVAAAPKAGEPPHG